jgi:hypothetical protein
MEEKPDIVMFAMYHGTQRKVGCLAIIPVRKALTSVFFIKQNPTACESSHPHATFPPNKQPTIANVSTERLHQHHS